MKSPSKQPQWNAILEKAKLELLLESPAAQLEFRTWLSANPPPANSDFASVLLERVSGPSTKTTQQDPRFFYKGIRSQPWFDEHQGEVARWTRILENGYADIKEELMALKEGQQGRGFQEQPEKFVPRRGDWNFFYLTHWGHVFEENCRRCPKTYELIKRVHPARNAPGVAGFSTLTQGAHVLPHSDPINLRVRYQMGLVIPHGDCRIRVGGKTRCWTEGKCILFDDSFEHETWNNEEATRLVFALDLWHPALSESEREYLEAAITRTDSPLFNHFDRDSAAYAAALGSQAPTWWRERTLCPSALGPGSPSSANPARRSDLQSG